MSTMLLSSIASPTTSATQTTSPADSAGATIGSVRLLLRLESLATLAVLVVIYHQLHFSWTLFGALFLVPDLAMLPYLTSKAAGAAAYNAAHNFAAPALCCAAAQFMNSQLMLAIALIWAAHIAFDRAVGYGLKYATGFGNTHLGRVGRAAPDA